MTNQETIHNKLYKITSYKNAKEPKGIVVEMTFLEMYQILKDKCVRTKETVEEYKKFDRETKTKTKDKGGFIAGETKLGLRHKTDIINRNMVSLDLDYCPCDVFDVIKTKLEEMPYPFLIYTTHSHTPESPRLRIIIPLAEPISAELYPLVAMQIASVIGEECFDATTYEPNRLMFFPTCPLDGEYICEIYNADNPLAKADKLINGYLDTKDIAVWQKPHYIEGLKIKEIEDGYKDSTKTKWRTVNSFNTEYSITQAIDLFLGDIYTKEKGDRYTYNFGETKNGLVIINNQYAYSHHGTDPANGRLLSAFDIVRIHKFGKGELITGYKREDAESSFKQMNKWLEETLPNVMRHDPKRQQVVIDAKKKVEEIKELIEEEPQSQKYDLNEIPEWDRLLQFTRNGEVKRTADNIMTILKHDNRLKDLFFYDIIKQEICFQRTPYWDKDIKIGDGLRDIDFGEAKLIIGGSPFFITGETAIYDAIRSDAYTRRKNYIKDFLNGLPKWDNIPRVETLFIDLFGVKDLSIVREASKKWLTALVARIFEPGAKFDYVIALIGAVGIGKSMLGKSLVAADWQGDMTTIEKARYSFTDADIDLKNQRDTIDALRGACVVELAEFDKFFRKYDKAMLKAFLTKTKDRFIERYGKRSIDVPRTFVMIATSNTMTPIKDPDDERRFIPFYCTLPKHKANIFNPELWNNTIRDQVMAEALFYYKSSYSYSSPFNIKQQREWENLLQNASIQVDEYDWVIDYVTTRFPYGYLSCMDLADMIDMKRKNQGEYRTEFCLEEIYNIENGFSETKNVPFVEKQHLVDSLTTLGFAKVQMYRKSFGVFGQKTTWALQPNSPLWVLQESKQKQEEIYNEWSEMLARNELGKIEMEIYIKLKEELGEKAEVKKIDNAEEQSFLEF